MAEFWEKDFIFQTQILYVYELYIRTAWNQSARLLMHMVSYNW